MDDKFVPEMWTQEIKEYLVAHAAFPPSPPRSRWQRLTDRLLLIRWRCQRAWAVLCGRDDDDW